MCTFLQGSIKKKKKTPNQVNLLYILDVEFCCPLPCPGRAAMMLSYRIESQGHQVSCVYQGLHTATPG